MSVLNKFKTKSGKNVTIGTGSGTKWQILKKGRPEEEQNTLTEPLVEQIVLALQNGFNHIDTAEIYTTHPEVGEAIKRADVKREDIWITDKYNGGIPGYMNAETSGPLESVDIALKEIGTDYLDLYLLHTPLITPETSGITLEDAWKQLETAKDQGKVLNIGVSNHAVEHLERIAKIAKYKPFVNQIEFHVFLSNQSEGIYEYSKENDIILEAYSPLAPIFRTAEEDPEKLKPLKTLLAELNQKYGKNDAQILLKWVLQRDVIPITTSSKAERIRESLDLFDFELTAEEVQSLTDLGNDYKFRAFFGAFFDKETK